MKTRGYKGKRHKWVEANKIKVTAFRGGPKSAWQCIDCGVYSMWYNQSMVVYSFSLDGPWEQKVSFICDNRVKE